MSQFGELPAEIIKIDSCIHGNDKIVWGNDKEEYLEDKKDDRFFYKACMYCHSYDASNCFSGVCISASCSR